jgi:membrane protein implicated in regulation of membrane protease activity
MVATIWAVLGLLLILSEFVVPQFVVFFFGLGALLNGLLVAIVPGLSGRIPAQILLWLVTSSFSLGFLRKYFARTFRGSEGKMDDSGYVGKNAEVIEPIEPDKPGRVRFAGSSWRAIAYDETVAVGERVTILQKEGLTLVVSAQLVLDQPDE